MTQGNDLCFELARMLSFIAFIASLGHLFIDDTQLTSLLSANVYTELTELSDSQFIRLSREIENSCRGLEGTPVIKLLKELCLVANQSGLFCLNLCKKQWLRTVFKPKDDSSGWSTLSSSCFDIQSTVRPCEPYWERFQYVFDIQSNVLPCEPYWQRLQYGRVEARRDRGDVSKGEYFPSIFLKEDFMLLADKLKAWKEKGEECKIVSYWHKRFDGELSKIDHPKLTLRSLIWKITSVDVKLDGDLRGPLGEGNQACVERKLWRGGIFARKEFKYVETFDKEVKILGKIGTHPHIVYSFGWSEESDPSSKATGEKRYSLWMEKMDRNLWELIEDPSEGQYLLLVDLLEILVQISKAMTHLHELEVAHGDLKTQNVLTSQCEILEGVHQYIVKVADFGSARILQSEGESTFKPADTTTEYAAPEVLKARRTGTMVSGSTAKECDIYSFGILAFEVLAGETAWDYYEKEGSKEELDIGGLEDEVIAGRLRPNLREACGSRNFWIDSNSEIRFSERCPLINLIESCWHHEPSKRPSFSKVTKEIESMIHRLQNPSPMPAANLQQ